MCVCGDCLAWVFQAQAEKLLSQVYLIGTNKISHLTGHFTLTLVGVLTQTKMNNYFNSLNFIAFFYFQFLE